MVISVITPIYKGKKYIPGLVDNINRNVLYLCDKPNMKEISVELILVNDSPEESISDIADNISKCSSLELKVINNDKNRGIHYTRANGLKNCHGDYVLFLDQDDYLEDNAIYRLIKAVLDHKEVSVVVANGTREYINCKSLIYKNKHLLKQIGKQVLYIYGTDLIFSPGQCLIKTKDIPGEWTDRILEINGCDDMLLWLIMLNKGCKMTGIADVLYHHRETDENYSNSFLAMQKSFSYMCDILEKLNDYPSKKVRILRRRCTLKGIIKSKNTHTIIKVVWMIKNIRIMIVTAYYKLYGFH